MPKENHNQAKELAAPGSASGLFLSVVIPARDEARSLWSLIPKIKETLSGYRHEIIVVDDGSTDGTGTVARRNGTIVISHKRNRGKGIAMKTGVQNASGNIIVFLDGDGAHHPQDVPKMITPILEGRADLVIGSRALPESRALISPLTRRLSNNLASLTISVIISFLLPLATLLGHLVRRRKMLKRRQLSQLFTPKWIRITDCTSGFRTIKREAWQRLALVSQGFQIETEMVYEAARNKLVIGEVSINCTWSNELSRLSILRDGLGTLKLLASKLVNDIRGK